MKKKILFYLIITLSFIIISFGILSCTDLKNNVSLSISIEMILILYLVRISYGCLLYIRKQYMEQKYSYAIIMNLGLFVFLVINIFRLVNLLVVNWHEFNITVIYSNTLESFAYYASFTLPCIIILSIYSIITNAVLIKKEGFGYRKLLGIILGILAFIGMFGGQLIYHFVGLFTLTHTQLFIKKFVDIHLNVTLSYLYSIIIATLYCNIMAAKHNPKYNKDYVIILGSKVGDNGELTPLLRGRVDRALTFGKNQKNATKKEVIYVPSGGKGSDEIISEAEAIQKYLIKQGVPKKNIIIENQSTSTIENMRFSKKLIDSKKKDANIAFSTTNYHVFRSGVIANEEGIDCEGMGSRTKWYFYSNALIREFIAGLITEKWRHIGLLIVINIIIFILTYIGFVYHFFHV